MWPFKKCDHDWELTNVAQCKHGPCEFTNVHRICLKCLKRELQQVTGFIDWQKSYKIFGGQNVKK